MIHKECLFRLAQIARAMPWPCTGPSCSTFRISRSSVPCSRAIRSDSSFWVGIRQEYAPSRVGCQQEAAFAVVLAFALAFLSVIPRSGGESAFRSLHHKCGCPILSALFALRVGRETAPPIHNASVFVFAFAFLSLIPRSESAFPVTLAFSLYTPDRHRKTLRRELCNKGAASAGPQPMEK